MAFEEQIILEVEVDESDAIESIESLTAANKKLREERKSLNLLTEEGRKRTAAINAQIDKNTATIKQNVSALEKQKMNIGNYASALDNVIPGVGAFTQGVQGGVETFKKFTAATKAWMLLGIGAIIAAVVAVFQLLKAAISTNAEFMDKFENITNAVSVVMDVLLNRVGKLGAALVAFASGNFSEGVSLTAEAFTGLSDAISNAIDQQQMFLDLSRELEDSQRNLRIEAAKNENEIKRLVVAAKNRNLTFDEQEKLLRQALALEEELVAKRAENAQKDLVITARRLRADQEFQQQSNETFEQYIDRLLTGGKLQDEELDKLVEKIEALEQARGSSLAFQEKVENSLATIQEKRAAALEKQNAALREQAELRRAEERAQANVDNTTDDPLLNAFETQAQVRIDIEDRMQAELKARKDAAAAEDIQRAKKGLDIQRTVEDQKLQAAASVTGAIAGLLDEQGEAYKVAASAQVIISTYAAATKAYEAAFLPIPTVASPGLGVAFAAAAVLQGIANLAKINGVEFAEGGYTGPGHRLKPAGIVHAGEVVWSQQDVAAVGGPMAANRMRPTYRGYADGGLVTNSISQPINQQLELSNIFKNMPPIYASWSEGRKVGKRIEFKEQISKR